MKKAEGTGKKREAYSAKDHVPVPFDEALRKLVDAPAPRKRSTGKKKCAAK
jgi:hypothetical protein